MVRLSVLPALLVVAVSAAAIAFALGLPGAGPDPAGWSILAAASVLGCGIVAVAAAAGGAEARNTARRYAALRRSGARSQTELHETLRRLAQGERLEVRPPVPLPRPSGDSFDLLTHEVTLAQQAAEAAVIQTAQLVRGTSDGSQEKVEVFVNLARRLQSLVHREIELLDELENAVEDPDLLKGLFHIDHLATRIRRHAENLAVLGGAISRRQWSRPVTMTEVLRSSIAEVEQYSRVKLVPPIEGTLQGHAVADVIHLLAELVENATVFSAPQTHVLLRAQKVTSGLAIEVDDRGLGMPSNEQMRMNALLTNPKSIDVSELLRDGRIGLFVVSALARRHGIAVQLQSNIYGGIQAVLVLPQGLLGDEPEDARPAAANSELAEVPAPQQSRAVEPDLPVRAGDPPRVASGASPASAATASEPRGLGERPELPRRRQQQHLVPELRKAPDSGTTTAGDQPEHDPELMAAFRRGFSLAEVSDELGDSPADSDR